MWSAQRRSWHLCALRQRFRARSSGHAKPIWCRRADLLVQLIIDGALGQDSTFDGTFGYYADGVEFSTVSYAPDGWRDRTIRFATAGTEGATGLCMEPHDLAISKLCAGREKDLTFVRGVIEAGLAEIDLLFDRLGRVSAPPEVLTLARQRLQAFRSA